MRTFQYIITNLGINFLVITLPKITKQKRDIKKKSNCYLHPYYMYTYSVFIAFISSVLTFIGSFFGNTIYDKIGILIFSTIEIYISLSMYLIFKNTRYILYREYFEYYNMFSKKKSYKYSECTYKLKRKSFKIYCNNKFACKVGYDKYKIIERIDKSKLDIDAKNNKN